MRSVLSKLTEYFDLAVGLWPFTYSSRQAIRQQRISPTGVLHYRFVDSIDAAAFRAAASQRVSIPANSTQQLRIAPVS